VLRAVQAVQPAIGAATVYRTLKLFVEAGLAHERNFGDGQARYEAAHDDEHHHVEHHHDEQQSLRFQTTMAAHFWLQTKKIEKITDLYEFKRFRQSKP
jgi:Fur family ferric uptake transcriptional regulator